MAFVQLEQVLKQQRIITNSISLSYCSQSVTLIGYEEHVAVVDLPEKKLNRPLVNVTSLGYLLRDHGTEGPICQLGLFQYSDSNDQRFGSLNVENMFTSDKEVKKSGQLYPSWDIE